jgi:hypothetical protein
MYARPLMNVVDRERSLESIAFRVPSQHRYPGLICPRKHRSGVFSIGFRSSTALQVYGNMLLVAYQQIPHSASMHQERPSEMK